MTCLRNSGLLDVLLEMARVDANGSTNESNGAEGHGVNRIKTMDFDLALCAKALEMGAAIERFLRTMAIEKVQGTKRATRLFDRGGTTP